MNNLEGGASNELEQRKELLAKHPLRAPYAKQCPDDHEIRKYVYLQIVAADIPQWSKTVEPKDPDPDIPDWTDVEAMHRKGYRRGLPILVRVHEGLENIMACYDTGTHENHISYAKAIDIGCVVESSPGLEVCFQLPNGKIVKSLGYIDIMVQFARDVGPEMSPMICRFNVFERLALPVLIGMAFLRATETITKYTSRMVDLPGIWKRSLRLYSLGNATNQVSCIIEGRRISAAADTGSEIALISGTYARKRGFIIREGCEELELADGSLEYTSGFAYVRTSVLDRSHWEKRSTSISASRWKAKPGLRPDWIRFHILECLQLDVLLDERTSDVLNVFKNGFVKFMSDAPDAVPSISPIIHLSSVEASLARASDALGEKTKAIRRPSGRLKHWLSAIIQERPRRDADSLTSPPGVTSQIRAKELPHLIVRLDQAENRRLDRIERRGASAADDVDKRRYTYEREELLLELQRLNSTPAP